MKVAYSAIGFLLFFTLVIRSVISSQKKQNDKPDVWKETVGTLDPRGHSPGTISYEVDGKMYYRKFFLTTVNSVLGEKYTMRYKLSDPEDIEIDYWHPVFLEGEKTHKFKAVIEKVHKKSIWDPTPFVTFSFDVRGTHFRRLVYLPKNYEDLYPDLKSGQYYDVECWVEDINRIVLHLDKPLKDR